MNKYIIDCIRGAATQPIKALYDTFDSRIFIKEPKTEKLLTTIKAVNTDFCNGYAGGILAEGSYGFLCANRRDTGRKVLFLFQAEYLNEVNSLDDLTDEMRVLPSLIPNPNHDGKHIITNVLVHCDSISGGWSHGCITVYPDWWTTFILRFDIGDKGILRLSRAPEWIPPDYYKAA